MEVFFNSFGRRSIFGLILEGKLEFCRKILENGKLHVFLTERRSKGLEFFVSYSGMDQKLS